MSSQTLHFNYFVHTQCQVPPEKQMTYSYTLPCYHGSSHQTWNGEHKITRNTQWKW